MTRLHEIQSAMAEMALDRRPAADLLGFFGDDRAIPLTERLQIHRNNTQFGLTDPLRAGFPVLEQLVGGEFFAAMARDFIRAFPPRRADLAQYGHDFPGFIADYAPAASVPYLADMARLELALMVAELAADRDPLAPAALQSFPPDRLEHLLLTPHPSLRFVASQYPLQAIWQAHQREDGPEGAIDLDQGGDMLLVYRPRAEALIRKVSAGGFAFVMGLSAGHSISGAYQSAIANHAEFDLAGELGSLLAAELFIDARLP